MHAVLIVHIVCLEISALFVLIKTVLLWRGRHESFFKISKWSARPTLWLLATGLIAGIYLVYQKFHGIVPPWLLIKLAMIVIAFTAIKLSERHGNKFGFALGSVMLILIIVQANLKFTF